MTATDLTTLNTPPSTRRSRALLWMLLGIVLALIFSVVLTVHVAAGGITDAASISKAIAAPAFTNMLGMNVLVGLAAVLFVNQTGWGTLRVILTVGAALLIGFILMLLISHDPLKAYNALLTGPLSRTNRWGSWVEDAMALTLVGLSITLVFRAQLFSLGAEGQIALGAMAAALVALYVPPLPLGIHIPLAVLAGCAAGFLWGMIPGILRAYLNANELVSTLMLNPIAALIYSFILDRIKPKSAGFTVSEPLTAALLPRIIDGTRVTTGIFFVIAAVIITWLIIQRTPLGYEIRTIGANIKFARYGGIDTKRTIVLAMSVSGVMAGLTGVYLALGIHQKLILGLSGGLAFEGIVVALLARNKPLAVPAMALLYSYLRVGGPIMQTDASVSLEIIRVIQSIIILLFTADGLIVFIQARRTKPKPPISEQDAAHIAEGAAAQP
ncbi:MAG: ABC transporter permease [Chloroflexota bacterium]